MKKDETNILILMKPTGQKFTYAQQWGLFCLKPSWIYESVEKGYIVETRDYIVKNSMLSSTPASSNVKRIIKMNISINYNYFLIIYHSLIYLLFSQLFSKRYK